MKSDEKFLKKQKKALLLEKERLGKKIAELNTYPDYGRGEDDNAREVSDFESNLSVETQLKQLLKKTRVALRAIENGSYGKCKICKHEIEKGRLESMPYANICVSCKKQGKK